MAVPPLGFPGPGPALSLCLVPVSACGKGPQQSHVLVPERTSTGNLDRVTSSPRTHLVVVIDLNGSQFQGRWDVTVQKAGSAALVPILASRLLSVRLASIVISGASL